MVATLPGSVPLRRGERVEPRLCLRDFATQTDELGLKVRELLLGERASRLRRDEVVLCDVFLDFGVGLHRVVAELRETVPKPLAGFRGCRNVGPHLVEDVRMHDGIRDLRCGIPAARQE